MDWLLPYLFFFMSAYAVIANDSIQTLGTWMVSNKKVKWYWLATYASFGLILTIGLGWLINGGDISYGRLEKIPLRPITWVTLTLSLLFFTFAIFFIFRENGGSIQKVVINKTGTKYVRSATLKDFVFAIILLFFKEFSSIPMSTTWVFIGLLSGRELSIPWVTHERDFKTVFPIIRQDFTKLIIGMGVSVFVAWFVNQVK